MGKIKWDEAYFVFLAIVSILLLAFIVVAYPSESYLEALRQWGF